MTIKCNIAEEKKRIEITFEEAIVKAKDSTSIQDKVDFVVNGAISQAEKVGNTKDLRTKLDKFYDTLKSGSEMTGLNGQWYALVTHKVAGWDHWAMKTSMYNSRIINGSDGCRYYAAFCN